jgi:hypothetical protein
LDVIKHGRNEHSNRSLCKSCGKTFSDKKRIDARSLYDEYVFGKQSLAQLASKYGKSVSTIQRTLKTVRSTRIVSKDKEVVVLMDTTYWGRNFGVVVFKDAHRGKILWRKFVRYETLADYQEGVEWLENHGFKIEGVVCDGLRGMFGMLSKYRVQMCQYHQLKIVIRYLTRSPELPASQELLATAKSLCNSDKQDFIHVFEAWAERWSGFIGERTVDPATGKSRYTHRRLRSAYLSLRRNMHYLWTFSDYPNAKIPNTNNALEGQFADLKSKLRNHNGLSKEHRKVFIDRYFTKHYR